MSSPSPLKPSGRGETSRRNCTFSRCDKSQGYLGAREHKGRVRNLLPQLARRTLARFVRGDWHGFRSHSILLRKTALSYVLGRHGVLPSRCPR